MKQCLDCGKELKGRIDKKFCSDYCRSSYHFQQNRSKPASLYLKIDQQLKRNRKILAAHNKDGRTIVRKPKLIDAGFHPRYFTHYWRAGNNNLYRFCYEYGFLEKYENGKRNISKISDGTSSISPMGSKTDIRLKPGI